MRILLVIDEPKDDEYYKKYSNYALREDIITVEFKEARIKIETILLQMQQHIDVIVLDVNEVIDFEVSDNILTYIRTSVDYTYSNKNFNFNYMPIVFIYKNYMTKRNGEISLSRFNYNIQYDNMIIPLNLSGMSTAIDNWLSTLASDLDALDLNINFDFSRTNDSRNEEKINDCKILTRYFQQGKLELDYNWIGNKLNLLEEGGDSLNKILKRYESSPRLRNEKEIHYLLNTHKAFLLEEKYKKSFYEQHLYYPLSKKYVEVDFINISHSYYNLPLELFEVKLPNHSFVSKKGILYNSTKKYLNQIGKRYKEYFDNQQHHSYIEEKLKTKPIPFNLSLLIGRANDIEENKYLIGQTLQDYNQLINIKSYDDLLGKFDFVYKRIKRFNIS